MGLSSLSSALSGLRVNQQQIDVISTNIANVGTEGFTRKILPQSSRTVDGQSIGVVGETIIRNVDLNLERDLWTQVSAVSFYDVQSEYLNRIDGFHGNPSANISVASEVTKLQDSFAALANSPNDQFLLTDTLDQAIDTANKINDLADFYTNLRNDVQQDATITVQNINDLMEQIAELNSEIRFATVSGSTTAAAQDLRGQAVKDLSDLIEISTFTRGDGVLVVQTKEGVELVSETATNLVFRPTPLSATTAYPDGAAGIFVGDPQENANAIDITHRNLGGKLGGLIELRDTTLPKQMAQVDELAHKMALRFEAQGLRMFTDASGNIPADTPPDPSVDPPVSVEYVGFASVMQVNNAVRNDQTLIQSGTSGATIQSGANDVIRRVIEFVFGNVNYQTAINNDAATSIDIRAAATGTTTLQDWLGLSPTNRVASQLSLGNYASVADIVNAGGTDVFGTPPADTDALILRFDDPDIGGGPYDIEIDLRTVVSTGASAAQDLVDHIMADGDFANAVADYGVSVSAGANGELVIESGGDIQILADPTEPLSPQGFDFLGLGVSTSEAQDPYFDVSVGNNAPVRITIEPLDTEVELLAKLNAVQGLAAQIDANGFLSLRPGNSFTNPDFGGDIGISGGPFETSGASLAGTTMGRVSVDDGVNIVQALFGTYQVVSPGVINETSPLVDNPYQSETAVGSGTFVEFRSQNLGPLADIDSEISSAFTLKDYSQKIVNEVAQELSLINARSTDEGTLQGLLEQQFIDESGVNIDEELGLLIVVQTSYAASARVVNAIDEIFDELLALL